MNFIHNKVNEKLEKKKVSLYDFYQHYEKLQTQHDEFHLSRLYKKFFFFFVSRKIDKIIRRIKILPPIIFNDFFLFAYIVFHTLTETLIAIIKIKKKKSLVH
jgi:hypothetical protein